MLRLYFGSNKYYVLVNVSLNLKRIQPVPLMTTPTVAAKTYCPEHSLIQTGSLRWRYADAEIKAPHCSEPRTRFNFFFFNWNRTEDRSQALSIRME